MSFHIENIPDQPPDSAIVLREAWREGKRTIASLSKFPPDIVAGFHTVPKGGLAVFSRHGWGETSLYLEGNTILPSGQDDPRTPEFERTISLGPTTSPASGTTTARTARYSTAASATLPNWSGKSAVPGPSSTARPGDTPQACRIRSPTPARLSGRSLRG